MKKKRGGKNNLKVELTIVGLVLLVLGVGVFFFVRNTEKYDYIVETNAFFAPFEYYKDRKIVGVDVDIINNVARKMGKSIDIRNVEFDVIIDNVEKGVVADAGAAGLTITPAREEKVNFSIPYYTSVQYLICAQDACPEINNSHVVWESLAGAKLGSQTGSTGYMFASDEIEKGALRDTVTEIKGFDSHQLAADAISAHIIDYAIADELAAEFIVQKNPELTAFPLYYTGEDGAEDYPVEESYAIAVNKDRPELLEAFNEVLEGMLVQDESGKSEIDKLVLKYMGLINE